MMISPLTSSRRQGRNARRHGKLHGMNDGFEKVGGARGGRRCGGRTLFRGRRLTEIALVSNRQIDGAFRFGLIPAAAQVGGSSL